MMRKLTNITLVCIDCVSIGNAVLAIRNSLEQIQFERVLLLTNVQLNLIGIEVVLIDTIKSKREYSEFCIKKLSQYITTDYFMIIQGDGFIIDGNAWDDKYLDYDYIGASWTYDSDRQVGNGGASLRSKKLHDILAKDDLISVLHPEDQSICIVYKFYLEEKYGIKFAPVELADKFSYELKEPTQSTFAFHGNFYPKFKPVVVIKRTSAMGDCIGVEPVLEYFYRNGYRVVLDTLPQFKQLFEQHYFKVEFFDQFDSDRIPYRLIDLDMSYESKPQQLHLKTYYEFAGIKDGAIFNPRLNLFHNTRSDIKLFEKYCIIHIDNREQKHRNAYGVNWETVCFILKEKGYTVIQIGKDRTCDIKGATRINTPTTQFMMWVIASSDLFIGVDSGPSHIASGFNIPSILFFGSVNPEYIHPDIRNKIIIKNTDVCDTPHCWSNVIGTVGQDCYIDNDMPPCTQFKTTQLIEAINKF